MTNTRQASVVSLRLLAILLGSIWWGPMKASAQVDVTINGPSEQSNCGTLRLTNRFVNLGGTLSGLFITNTLPSASYAYLPGETVISLPGGNVLTNALADPSINLGNTNLVWDFSSLVTPSTVTHLLITEVFFNTTNLPKADFEWVELYNPTSNAVSIAGWSIQDTAPGQVDALPPITINPGEFVVVAGRTNAFYQLYPGFTGVVVEVVDGTIGSGLNTFGDGVILLDTVLAPVDAVSYGSSTVAFSPSVPSVAVGRSIARNPADVDTDTRNDWVNQAIPDPGAGLLPVGIAGGSEIVITYSVEMNCDAISGEFFAHAGFEQPPGSPRDESGSAFVTVNNPDIVVIKSPILQSGGILDSVVWNVRVQNAGFGTAPNVVIRDLLGPGLTFTGFSVNPTDSVWGASVTWDASVIPALSNLPAQAFVDITVTAQLTACVGLFNLADATWSCRSLLVLSNNVCEDTAVNNQTASAGVQFVDRFPFLTGSFSPDPLAASYCGGSDVTLYLTNQVAPGSGPAVNIQVESLLPPGWTVTGNQVNSNGTVMLGTLLVGSSTSVVVRVVPGGTCPLELDRQAAYFLASFDDGCGNPFFGPLFVVPTDVEQTPAATITKIMPASVNGDDGSFPVRVELTYSNFVGTESITITDVYPNHPNLIATNSSSGGVISGGSVTWADVVPGPGSGVLTTSFDIVILDPCGGPNSSTLFNQVFASTFSDCLGCDVDVAGSGFFFPIDFDFGSGCGIGGTGGCSYATSKQVSTSLVEVCKPVFISQVVTNFSGTLGDWTGVAFSSDLGGTRGYLDNTNDVVVEVNGSNLTLFVSINVVASNLVIEFDGLNASIYPTLTTSTSVRVTWPVSVSTPGQAIDVSSFSVSSCGSFSRSVLWLVGETDISLSLAPILVAESCGITENQIELFMFESPAGGTERRVFSGYDVEIELNLDQDGNGNSTFSYVPGSTVFSNIVNLAGASLAGFDPVIISNRLVWSLGDIRSNENITVHYQLRADCGSEDGGTVAARLRYNNYCDDDTLPPLREMVSSTINNPPLLSANLINSLQPGLQFLTSTQIVVQVNILNSGGGAAYNLRAEMVLPPNVAFGSAEIAPTIVTSSNVIWEFDTLTGPFGPLTDRDGDTRFDDLPSGPVLQFWLTNNLLSCTGGTDLTLISSYGCDGEVCDEATVYQSTFVSAAGSLVTRATFPAEATLCATNPVEYRVRNSGITVNYDVQAFQVLPLGMQYVTGSSRVSINGGPTNSISDPPGDGSSTNPLTWTLAEIPLLAAMQPNDEVAIFYEVDLGCTARLGNSQFVSLGQFTDTCGNITSNRQVVSVLVINEPGLQLTKEQTLDIGDIGQTNIYTLTLRHAAGSNADVPYMELTDDMPAALTFLGASTPPDAIIGNTLIWSNSTLNALTGDLLPPYQIAEADIVITITAVVNACEFSVVNVAEVNYGCELGDLCDFSRFEISMITTPDIALRVIPDALNLTPCGGIKRVVVTNSGATAFGLVITETAPTGYIFTAASVTGHFNSASAILALSGSPVGKIATIDFTTAAASGAADVADDRGDGLGNLDLGQRSNFAITYTLISDGTTLECLADPTDFDFEDPELDAPSLVLSPTTLTFTNLCLEPGVANRTASVFPDIPDLDIDVQPNSLIVTNGQVINFSVTIINDSETINAGPGVYSRVRLGEGWTDVSYISNWITSSSTTNMTFTQLGNTNLIFDFPDVVLDPIDDRIRLFFTATATDNSGPLDVYGEVAGDCGIPAITPDCVFSNIFGEPPFVDTMTNAVNGQYFSFDQDRFVAAGQTLSKTVRYDNELPSAAGSRRDARIGEALIYRLESTYFGGVFSNVTVRDSLPVELLFGIPTNYTFSGGVTGAVWDANTGVFTLYPTVFTTNPSSFSVDIPIVVSNRIDVQDGIVITNEATTAYFLDGITNIPEIVTAEVPVLEPELNITKLVNSNVVQAGDIIIFTNRLVHTVASRTSAYSIVFTDTLPAGLAFDAFIQPASGQISGQTITFTTNHSPALNEFALGDPAIEFIFSAVVTNQIIGAPIINTSRVTYVSLDNASTNGNERTGDDGPGGLNDYVTSNTATLVSAGLRSISKTYLSSSQTNTIGSGGTNDWTIGERFVYEIRVDIPQGIIITNMIITDVVPAGIDWVGINTNTLLSFPSAGFQFVVPPGGPVFPTNIASGLVITDPDPTPESSTTADGSGQAIVFTIPGVTNIADGIATNDYFLLQMEFVALDMATNVGIGAATRVSNNVVRVRDPYVSLSATSSNYRIVAHDMAVRKDRSPALGDAGDIVTFSLYVTNRPAARANAYDLRVTDVLSSNFYDLSTFSLISIPEGWGWTNIGVAGGMRFEMFSSNNVALPPATGVTGVFQLAIADHVRPNQRFTNRMDLTTATTLYGPPPSGISERNLTANNSTVFAITNMSLAKSLFTTSETNVPPDSTNHFVQIGETLTYRIDVIVPESTITNLTITDFMSTNGLAYIYGSARLDTNNFQGSLGALVESPTGPGLLAPMGQVMTFRFTNTSVIASSNGTSNNNFSLFIDYLVLDTNVNIGLTGNQTVHTNRANLTFPGNSSNAVVSGVVTSTVVEPALVISKSFSTNTLDAGDAKTVTLVVSNRGLATAYDIEIADDVSAFGGVFSSLTNLVAPTGFIFDVSSDPIVYIRSDTNTAPGTNAIVAGQALTFTFDLVLGQDVSPNQIYTNTATVRGDSLDGTNIFAVQRFTTNSASDTIEIYNFTFLKERIATSENGPVDSSGAFVQIGEVVTYRLTANLPEGTITNLSIIDSVPAGMSYVVGSLALDTSDFVGVISAPLVTPDSGTLAASGEDLSISFPGNTIVQPSLGTSNHIIRLTFDLLVLDVPENSGLPPVPTLLTNTASITYENNPQPPVVSTQVVVEVIEPQPSITKTLNPVAGDAGDSITVTLIVTNSGTATAFDLAVSDPLDGPIFDISTISAVTTPDGFLFSVSTNLPNATVFYISDKAGTSQPTNALVVGERLEFVFNVVLAQTVTPGYVHTNTATLTATTIDGTNIFAVERSYTNQSEALLTVSNMTIAKALVGTSANGVVDTTGSDLTIGEIATYRLTVTLPESTITNLTVVDLVPSGMRYVTNTVNVDTTGFGGTLPGVPSILTAGGDGDDVTIRFDGLTTVTDDNNGANNQFVIDLNMVVLDVPGNTGRVAGSQTVLPNSATIAFGGNPPVSTSGVVVIEVTEPRLTLDKTMSPASNALVVIDLVVSNAGLSAAFDVVLEDTLTTNWWDATTIAPVTVPPGFVFAVTGAPGDAVITLAVDSGSSQPTNAIIPGQALLFQFSAQLRAGAPSPVTNRSSITEYSTLENDDPEERIYGPVEDEAILAIPGVALSKVLLSPIGRSAGVGEVVTFAITVTNTGGVGLNPLVLVDTFDPVYLSFLSATGAPSSVIGNTITWTNVGPLLPGASTNLIVSFSAEQSTAADETTNRVVLTSFTTNGIPLLPITSSAPVTVANPGYLLTKDLTSPLGRPAILGEPVIFLLTIVNTGDVDLVTVPVFDTYETNYLAYVSSVPVSDDTVNDGAINWSDIGPLPVGASTSIVVTFTGAGDTMGALRTNVVVTTPTTPPDQPPVPPLTNTAPYVIDTPASLGDFVWNDLNADGIQDGIETGIVGVVVTLFSSNNIALGVSTTDVAGAYAFTNLIPGVYYIDVTIPPGYFVSPQNIGTPDLDSDIDPVTGQSTLITLVSGQNDPTWDAGLYLPASLGDFVWLDTNGNGIQDGGETGVVNVLVTLYDAASNALDTATTDISGFYTFTNLMPATYFVGFTPPSGLQFTLINQGSDDSLDSDANPITGLTVPTTLISGENDPTWDAGLYAPASLGDFVWNDLNADGIQDGIETGIVGVVVTLFSSNNIAIGVTTTDVAGAYAFTNLNPGDYYIDVAIPPGYFVSPQNIGTPDLDSDIDPVTGQSTLITLVSGQNDPTWDAGLYLPASLGDFVWYDADRNGIQSGSETGVVNVLVRLYDSASNELDTATTDASGFYSFTNLVPATYFIGFDLTTLPADYVPTFVNQGGDPALDSDADPVTGFTALITLISGENDPTWDMGIKLDRLGYTLVKSLTSPAGRAAQVGEAVTFVIEITNTGVVDLVTVPVTDAYETNFLFYVSSVPSSTDLVNDGVINWTDIGPLSPGASTSVVVSFVAVASSEGLNRTNLVTTAPTTPPGEPPVPPQTNEAPYAISQPGYTLVKNVVSPVEGTAAQVGDRVTFTITVANTGDVPLVTVPITDFHDPIYLSYAESVPPADAFGAGIVQWTNIGPLAVGSSTSITVQFEALASTLGTQRTNVAVAAPTTPPDRPPVTPKTNEAPYRISAAGYSLAKTLTAPLGRAAQVGETITFAITITNTGEVDLVTVPVIDTYDITYLAFVSAVPVTVDDVNDGEVEWSNVGPLPVGASTNIVVTFTAAASSLSLPQTNVVTTAPTTPPDEPGVPPKTNEAPYEISLAGYSLVKELSSPLGRAAQVGEPITFAITVSNTGDVELVTVPVEDVYDVTYLTFDGSVPPPDDAMNDGVLNWIDIGPLPAGASTTLVVSFIANASSMNLPQTNVVSTSPTTPPDEPDVPPSTNEAPYRISSAGYLLTKDLTSPLGRPAILGEPVIFLLTIVNTGDVDLVTVPVFDTYETNYLVYVSSVPVSDDMVNDGAINWSDIGPLPVGATTSIVVTFTGAGDTLGSSRTNVVVTTPTTPPDQPPVPPLTNTAPYAIDSPASLGDFVWNDLNADGIQDGIETGIVGVVVTLFSSNNIAIGVTTTDVAGAYAFTNLIPGVYYIDVTIPPGYFVSPQNIGTPDLDSDIDPVTGQSTLITLVSGQNDPTWDAGLYLPASLGDFVWLDTNGNGIQDGGETGVVNVLVTLYDAASNALDTATTDTSGFYTFTNLVPATYFVGFTPPSGLQFTLINQGSDDSLDSDANPITGLTVPTTLISGENDPTWDAGLYAPASLGDFVWNDLNADGIQDGIETGIVGVVVTLFSSNNIAIGVTTTDVAGAYAFTNLIPGDYYIDVTIPPGYFVSPQNIGTPDLDSDIDPVTGQSTVITLISGQNDPTWDAGLYLPASLGDFVWLDTNGNGIQDGGETGVVNVLVTLYDAASNALDTTTTDASGFYTFTNLVPATYFVGFTPPSGLQFTLINQGGDNSLDSDANPVTGLTVPTTLISGENDPTWDAGLYAPASLGDFVWNDLNADGIQDGIETGIVGVVVTLFSSNNIALGVTTTDVAGAYAFTNLIPGVYYIDVAVPPGYFVSPQNIGTPDLDSDIDPVTGQTALITLVSGQNDPTWDAGLYLPASLGDFVWLDTNGNGIQDGGETGVVNVLVTLYDAASNTLDTTTTDAFGFYTFTNLVPATYFIGFTPPSGLQFTLINQGSDNTIDSDANPITGLTVPTTLISGENDPTWDAGLYAPASLGDFVWNDLNADGIQDGIETGIVGVVVTLFSSNNIAIGVTTTDVAGAYAFTNLIPGDYYIDVAIPPGYFVSPQNIGTPDLDSDIDPVTGQSTVITLISGQNDPTWDAGLYLPASLGDFVWFDADRNGIQSGSETGVVNVLVRLYDSASNELDTTTTDASGFYSFTNLVPSTYFIGFDLTTLPADYVATFINQGGDPALDSDADPVTGFTALITLISGENDPTWDMGIKLDRLGYTLVKSLTSPVGRAAQVGEAVTFVIEITNTGVVDLVTVPVTDVYETAYLSFITAVPASDNAQDTGLLTWSNVGPLPSGASTSIVVSFVAVQSSLGEERTNVVTTSPTTPPGELPVPTKTNEAPYRISQSGYVLTKVVVFPTNRPALVGEEIEFAITVENTGDVTLIEVPVTDLYDTNILSFVSSVPVVDQIAVDGSLSWTNIGPILPGTNATISVSFVTLESTLGEFLTNVVTTAPVTPTNSPPVDPQTNGAPYAVEYGLIGNTVWIDLNANGLPDEDLSVQGINGVRVRLFAVSGGVTNLVGEQFTATDAGQRGYYLFTGLPLGEYFVTVDVSTVPSSLPVNTTPVRVNASLTPDGFFVDADFGFIPADPTAVELIAFRAERRDEHVWLEWETAIEMNNMGFNIYRGTTPDGLRSRVNASLVPGRGTGEGGTYRLMDPELLPDGTYYYWLEDVEYDMSTREHGPVRIVIGNETVPDTLGTAFVQLHGLIMITPQTLLQSGLHPASVDATALRVLVDGQEVAAYVSASGAQMQSYDYIVAYIDNPNLDPVEVTLGYGDQGDPKRMGIAFAFVSAEDGNMMTVQAMPDGQVAAAAVNESYQRFLFTGMKSSNIWLLDINRPEAPSILIGFDVVNVNRATGVYFSYPIVPAVLAAFTTESIVELERLDR